MDAESRDDQIPDEPQGDGREESVPAPSQTARQGEAGDQLAGDDIPASGSAEEDKSTPSVSASAEAQGADEAAEQVEKQWFIVKVQVNREESIRRALERRIKMHGLDLQFGDIVVPTEDVAEYNKSGKRRIVKRKLYPGYIMIHMELNDDTWFLVRETPGIGDFTGSAGKPTPMADHEVQRIMIATKGVEAGESPIKTSIPFKPGDRVRVKEGYFENFEGDVDSIDQANGRVTVMINIFGRSTPVELEHWQIESV